MPEDRARHCDRHGRIAFAELEPEEAVWRERHEIGLLANWREIGPAQQLERNPPAPGRQVDLGGLCRARKIGDAEQHLVLVLPHVDQHRPVGRADEAQRAAPEHFAGLADRHQAFGPAQQRSEAPRLRLDVDGLIAVDRIHDRRRIEPRRAPQAGNEHDRQGFLHFSSAQLGSAPVRKRLMVLSV